MLAEILTLKFLFCLVSISLLVSSIDCALHYLGCKLFTGGFEMKSSFCSKSYTDFKLTIDIYAPATVKFSPIHFFPFMAGI